MLLLAHSSNIDTGGYHSKKKKIVHFRQKSQKSQKISKNCQRIAKELFILRIRIEKKLCLSNSQKSVKIDPSPRCGFPTFCERESVMLKDVRNKVLTE